MRLIWRSSRVAMGLALLAILAFGPLSDRDAAAPLQIMSDTPADDLVRVFTRDAHAGAVYADTVPPNHEHAQCAEAARIAHELAHLRCELTLVVAAALVVAVGVLVSVPAAWL